MILDLDRPRAETPGLSNRVHLNNAGAALMPARPCTAKALNGREAKIDTLMTETQCDTVLGQAIGF